MRSWKARLLMLLTTMAMILAVSVPVVAQADDGCIGVGTGGSDADCIGILSGDGSSSDNCGFDSNGNPVCDNNCDFTSGPFCDTSSSSGFDTISVGDLDCLVDEDTLEFCVDENGDVVNV